MALMACDIAGDERGTWQAVFDEFFNSPRPNRLHKWARESLSILFITSIYGRWQHNQIGPRIQKNPATHRTVTG